MHAHIQGKILGAVLLCLTVALFSGCSTYRVDRDHGSSVNHMLNAQIYDPNAAAKHNAGGAQGRDGERAVTDLNRLYRDSKSSESARSMIKLEPYARHYGE